MRVLACALVMAILSAVGLATAAEPAAPTPTAPAATPSAAATATAPSRQEAEALSWGKTLECVGSFDAAYNQYAEAAKWRAADGGTEAGRALLQRRANAMAYLARGHEESIYWKPGSAEEMEKELAKLGKTYDTYRKPVLEILKIVTSATKEAQGIDHPDKAVYQAKVQQVMDAYVDLVATSTPQQKATFTFQQLLESLRHFADVNKNWENAPIRQRLIKSAFMYAEACRERVTMEPVNDPFWERQGRNEARGISDPPRLSSVGLKTPATGSGCCSSALPA